MNTPRRGGRPEKGQPRPAAREGRSDSGRDGRKPAGRDGGRSNFSSARPSYGGPSGEGRKGFSKDRFVRGAGEGDSNERPQRGGDRPFRSERPQGGSDRPFRTDRPQGGGDRPFRSDRPQVGGDRPPRGNDRPFRSDRPARDGDRPFRNDRPERGGDRPFRADGPARGGDRPFSNNRPDRGGDRPFSNNRPDRGGDRPFRNDRTERTGDRPERGGDRPFRNDRPQGQGDRPFRGGDRPERGGDRPFRREGPGGDRKPFNAEGRGGDRPTKRSFDRTGGGDRPFRQDRPERSDRPGRSDRPERTGGRFQTGSEQRGDRPAFRRDDRPERTDRTDRPDRPAFRRDDSFGEQKRKLNGGTDRPLRRRDDDAPRERKGPGFASRQPGPGTGKPKSFTENAQRREQERTRRRADEVEDPNEPLEEGDGKIRLNKFIAASGLCSRREADRYIEDGRIAVNGKTVTELGYKVNPDDEVRLGGRLLRPEKHVYVLLNKPKNYITTVEDEEGRQTVMDLIGDAVKERVYPVGRLDRNTTGLLLLTNDGDLAERLMHPSFEIRKVYQVELDSPLSDADADKIRRGLMLEDGKATVDDMAILTPDRKSIGIEIHIGRNRIVRRIFEALGKTVIKLDRVMYGGLTKKDLPRGRWRVLSSQEVINLKHLGAGLKGGRK